MRSLYRWGFPGGSMVKTPPGNAGDAGDPGLIPGSGRSPGGGHGNPLQYSCLENPMDRGAWCYSPWGHKELDTTERLRTHALRMRNLSHRRLWSLFRVSQLVRKGPGLEDRSPPSLVYSTYVVRAGGKGKSRST